MRPGSRAARFCILTWASRRGTNSVSAPAGVRGSRRRVLAARGGEKDEKEQAEQEKGGRLPCGVPGRQCTAAPDTDGRTGKPRRCRLPGISGCAGNRHRGKARAAANGRKPAKGLPKGSTGLGATGLTTRFLIKRLPARGQTAALFGRGAACLGRPDPGALLPGGGKTILARFWRTAARGRAMDCFSALKEKMLDKRGVRG